MNEGLLPKDRKTARRWLEFSLLFVALPAAFASGRLPIPLIPLLLLGAALCALVLYRDPGFDRRRFWNRDGFRALWPAMKKRVLLAFFFLLGLTWLIDRGFIDAPTHSLSDRLLFYFPLSLPWFWLLVMLLYPLLSVYPQELIFRTFFFHRYEMLFGKGPLLILLSSLIFGLAHWRFALWPEFSVALSAIGGLIFALNYQRSQSTLAAAVEHAIYGDLIFTIGLGGYFFTGAG